MLKEEWSKHKHKFRACRDFAKECGWDFRIYTDRDIRTPRLFNAKFLLPYGEMDIDWNLQAAVMKAIVEMGVTTPRAVLERLSPSSLEQAKYLPALWNLLRNHCVTTDLNQKLTMSSRIERAKPPEEREYGA